MQNLLRLQTQEFGEKQDNNTAALIAELRRKIPPPILAHYDRLRVRGKKGLVPVVNQVCAGCHMRLPLAVVLTLKHDEDIQLCDSCGRYLYLPAVTESAADTKPSQPKPARSLQRRKKTVPPPELAAVNEAAATPAAVQARATAG